MPFANSLDSPQGHSGDRSGSNESNNTPPQCSSTVGTPREASDNLENENLISDDLNNRPNALGVETSTSDTCEDRAIDAKSSLKLLRLRNIGRVIVGYLNIN